MLNIQLEDHRTREVKALEKQDKYLEREDKLLQKLDEISCRQQPAPQVPLPLNPTPLVNQASEFLQYPYQRCGTRNPSVAACHGQPQFVWDSIEVPTSNPVRLHHIQPAPQPTLQNPSTEAIHFNVQAPSCREAAPVLDYYVHQTKDDAVVPSVNIQKQSLPSVQNPQVATHPTAAIAPMRPASQDQQPLCQQQGNVTAPVSEGISVEFINVLVKWVDYSYLCSTVYLLKSHIYIAYYSTKEKIN